MFKTENLKSIEEVLYDKGLITADQLAAIRFEHANTGKSIETILKERDYITPTDYAKSFGEVYGIEYANIAGSKIDSALLDLVPINVARKYKAIPFSLQSNQLSVAMADPLDLQTIEFIEKRTGYKVIPFIISESELDKIFDEVKSKAIGEEISAAMEEISGTVLKVEEGSGDLSEATLRDAPIARIVGMILETAVKIEASDIHVEAGEKNCRIRYRVDGMLHEYRVLPKEMQDSVIARIKILSGMKIDEKRIPQDGRFKVEAHGTQTDLRVSSLPTIYGEKIVIRLLKEVGVIYSLKDLGMRGISERRFEEAILKPNGIILVTGPTGSGKNVTLSSALYKLNTERVNIVTIEDPVEIRVPGVNHVQVNEKAGLTFANGLRAFLRQDPNIILVGEIRDAETAGLATQAALTGHLVLSTLHTNSSSGAIPRLLDMGVEDFLLASTINIVVAQRLVRRICKNCRESYVPPEGIKEEFEAVLKNFDNKRLLAYKDKDVTDSVKRFRDGKFELYRGKGCDKCGNSGYKGRIGIFEVLTMSDTLGHLVMENSPASKIESVAIEEGMITLMQDGYLRALEGTTSLEEVLRVARE